MSRADLIIPVCLMLAAPAAADGPQLRLQTVHERVESEKTVFRVEQIASGFEHPWALEFLPGGGLLVTERPGRLWLVESGGVTRVTGVPEVHAAGQGGLLDVAAHPDFSGNRIIYLSYAAGYGDGYGTRVARARLEAGRLEDPEVIFEMQPPGGKRVHYGSRFAFDDEGFLYVTLGERGEREYAQGLDNHRGKIVRLHDDGSVPADNPFRDRPGALPEIYSYGHRNPQGLLFDRSTGRLWSHEHGPRGGDALHVVEPGVNYGWPVATYGREYHGPGIGTTPDRRDDIRDPVIHWTPSIAPCGLALLRGSALPAWDGNLFAGALAGRHIRRIEIEDGRVLRQEAILEGVMGRIRDVAQGPDGCLWFATDDPNGGIFRIGPVDGMPKSPL